MEIESEVRTAILKYGCEHIDVLRNEETGRLFVMYHSKNNSFPVSNREYSVSDAELTELVEILDGLEVGHDW